MLLRMLRNASKGWLLCYGLRFINNDAISLLFRREPRLTNYKTSEEEEGKRMKWNASGGLDFEVTLLQTLQYPKHQITTEA